MENQSPPPPPQPELEQKMDSILVNDDGVDPSSLFDWSTLLDFDPIHFPDFQPDPFSPPPPEISPASFPPNPPKSPESLPPNAPKKSSGSSSGLSTTERVRKRDPRMSCSNFLAGLVPCACPELDAAVAAEEAEAGPGRKRVKVGAAGGKYRCQVPGCEVDISELKGYHKRHRVCLSCANSSFVVIEGTNKRYCQQCGKFHILSDFDEGKRSCRRKLERHNDRRRRKSSDFKSYVERELQLSPEDGCDGESGRDTKCSSGEVADGETALEAEVHNSLLRSIQNKHSDSIASFGASGETQTDEEKEKCTNSPSFCEDKGAFSSVCPTGRISFKLYDWNPAEFPRRLRHQIFQWLSSMPVELEGYIRPGCIILTMFIAMPKFMWVKLSEDPAVYIKGLLASPGSILSGRGTFVAYLNNMTYSVTKDGTSTIRLQVKEHAPKLHYVHPTCFEAGKPIEFIACGSNLLQPQFRFLVSFAGKYLTHDVCVKQIFNNSTGAPSTFDYQLLKIRVPSTESNVFGPGFIEVENESGISNFIPILVADKEICSEIERMQRKSNSSLCSSDSWSMASRFSLGDSDLNHSEWLVDIAWLLREPALEMENAVNTFQLQRFTCLLNLLIENRSTAILERVVYYVNSRVKKVLDAGYVEADISLLRSTMDHARDFLGQQSDKCLNLVLNPRNTLSKESAQRSRDAVAAFPVKKQDMEVIKSGVDASACLATMDRNGTVPLLNKDFIMSVKLSKEQTQRSYNCTYIRTNKLLTSRPFIFIVASAAICIGICAALLHPQKASAITTTIRRCLFDHAKS